MSAMTPQRWQAASQHLDRLLDVDSLTRREALDALRVEDPLVAADVEALLADHEAANAARFLEDGHHVVPDVMSLAGAVVGAYTLVSPIGQGGMGSVWLAERSDGRFEGRAAVKLLKAALLGRAGEERFIREGTILARLDHPNIARLIDAGVSAIGQPYLVLEHVEGRQIDQYCDEERLSIPARLRLFLDVLAAVAHAHANLIVHRDLKPSNVLVTPTGQVKLLDFGIAKWLEAEAGSVGPAMLSQDPGGMTPRYASPEQLTGGVITTAADVYALGVLLYTLLSGKHPVGAETTSQEELVKAIVVDDPRLASSAAIDTKRRDVLAGDLDAILTKALKKAPQDRYGSVAAFAADVRRYLDHQPISARPDVFAYRAGKFMRRHWRPLVAAVVVVIGAAGMTSYYTAQLRRTRDLAELQARKASRISELLTGLLTASDPYRTPDAQEPTVRNLLDAGAERVSKDLADQPDLQAEMLTVMGRVYQRMGLHAQAQPLLERALTLGRTAFGGDHAVLAQSLNDLGVLHRERGDVAGARPLLEECLAMRRRVLGPRHPDVAITLVELARDYKDLGRLDESEPLIREALDIRRAVFGERHRETATSTNELALFLWDRGQLDEAEQLFTSNLKTNIELLGATHVSVAVSYSNLALVINDKGRPAEAEKLFRQALAIHLNNPAVGRQHPSTAITLNNLSYPVLAQGRIDEAATLLEEAVAIATVVFKPDHPRLVQFQMNLGRAYLMRHEPRRAEALLRRAVEQRSATLPPTDWRVAQAQSLLGGALLELKQFARAEQFLLKAREHLKPIAGAQDRERRANDERLRALEAATRRSKR